jgi:protein TonB
MTRSSLSPFGALLAEIRENQAQPDRIRDGGRVSRTILGPVPEPELHIETRVVSAPRRSTSGMARVLWPASALLHAALLVAVIVVPLLRSEALPTPARETRAFFVAPGSPAVPLPPPPPPAARVAADARTASRPRVPPARLAAASFRASVDAPEPIVAAVADTGLGNPDENAPRAESGGVPGGMPGGVPGGIVGGVVVASVAVPPAPIVPVRVGGEIKEPKKIRHVDPVYPQVAVAAHVHGNVVLECLVDPQGRVTEVTLLRGVSILNSAAIDAVKQWRYTATLKDGVPVSVLLTVTVTFQLS